MSAAWARPTLDEVLGPETIAPPPARMVSVAPAEPLPEKLDPNWFADHSDALARFLAERPDRLEAAKMEPVLLLTLAQILLRGDHTFLAERLLWQGAQRWPDRVEVLRAWSRVLISLGRPSAARAALEKVVALTPADPVAQYLLARSLLSLEPRAPAHDRAARAALTQVLALAPTYRDADGVDAREIKMVIEQLDQQIAGKKPPAPR